MKKILLIFLILNANALELDKEYRKTYIQVMTNQKKNMIFKSKLATTTLISNSINEVIDLSEKENAFLTKKSISSTQSDLIILKNETINTTNELELLLLKKPKKN